jgi:protein gp37
LSIEPLLEDLGTLDLDGIHWVIVGGESGNGARPMHPDWARSIRDQCVEAKVPFFFKQWGSWGPMTSDGSYRLQDVALSNEQESKDWIYLEDLEEDRRENWDEAQHGDVRMYRQKKKAAGRFLDGRTWDEMPARST